MKIPIVFILFTLTSLAAGAQHHSWLSGQWTGTGYQRNNGHTWSIQLTCDPEDGIYSIEYPSLKCGGALKLNSMDETRAVFIEDIREGVQNCVDGGTLIVTLINSEYVTFSWFYPNGRLGAWSTLKWNEPF